jgi:two-component system LytT family response regulator
MTRILLLDDEEAACSILQLLVHRFFPGEHEIRAVYNPVEALEVLPDFRPHLVMLDIEMPEMSGFDFLNRSGSIDFDVIFVTAFDKYAIKAIRFSALDYLLKPVDIVELQNALNRFVIRRQSSERTNKHLVPNLIENVQKPEGDEYKLAISTLEGVFFYQPKDLIRCEGESNYTTFYPEHAKPLLVSHTLKDYESILREYGFVRVHRSHLVNLRFVERMDRDGFLWLTNGDSIPVSRRRKDMVMGQLKGK